MLLSEPDIIALVICALLTLFASLMTVVLSVLSGSALAYFAQPRVRYGLILAALLLPFAVGGSVWAYSVTRLAAATGLQGELVSVDTSSRCVMLLILCLARIVPLGTFFCATTLQRSTGDIRPYCRTHRLLLPFFLSSAVYRVPKSILTFLGLFGGAAMAAETSLPIFLYRANPGTPPETANVLLSRLFRENYATLDGDTLPQLAVLGLVVSAGLLFAAAAGTIAGRCILAVLRPNILRITASVPVRAAVSFVAVVSIGVAALPGLIAMIGIFLSPLETGWPDASAVEYRDILLLGAAVAIAITTGGIALAVRLRYGRTDWLRSAEQRTAAALLLLTPAFIPILTIVAALGMLTGGRTTPVAGYIAAFLSHALLHYPMFQFIAIALIATIPESHVEWQRTVRMRYAFSLMTDGFLRHAPVIVALIGLGTVQVVTDGSVARWFSSLIRAPEEALFAAVFGRLASVSDAQGIAWSVAVVAIGVSGTLAAAFVADLRRQSVNA